MKTAMTVLVAAVSILWAATAMAQPCQPRWSEEFATGDLDAQAFSLAWFDDGSGPALYVGGQFTTAGGAEARGIARWDGQEWSPVGGGVDGYIWTMTVHDDGSGPALFAAGNFTAAGGAPAQSNVAKWDGSAWTPLPGETDRPVLSLRAFDDGSGEHLYIGGNFTRAGGVQATRMARWDGRSWSALDSGVSGVVRAMDVFDDGSGPALYVAGGFNTAGGHSVDGIARWTGQSWEPVPAPPYSTGLQRIWDLAAWDDGTGPALYAAGRFDGGSGLGGIARFRAGRWDVLVGSPLTPSAPFALGPIEVEGRRGMGAAAQQINMGAGRVGAWIDGAWRDLGDILGTPNGIPRAILLVEHPSGPRTYLAGQLNSVDGVPVRGIAEWDGDTWSALEPPMGIPGDVRALHADGRTVYAGGTFSAAGSAVAARVAKYENGAWSALGGGFPAGQCPTGHPQVRSLLGVDVPTIQGLIAGGDLIPRFGPGFTAAIARWDGQSWHDIGGGLELRTVRDACPIVLDTAVFDDGLGPSLYATGFFDTPGWGVARWSGSAWEQVGGDVWRYGQALRAHDDGSGPALYVGGQIQSAGAIPVRNVARWDGQGWHPVGDGLAPEVFAFAGLDEDQGRSLIAGGGQGGSNPFGEVWRWDGHTWSRLGGRFDQAVQALAEFDDGFGPALYAGGAFTSIDGRPASGLARWDRDQWTEAAGGVAGAVRALEPAAHEGFWSLLVGGWFSAVGDGVPSQGIARLIGCQPLCYPDCDGDGRLTFFDFICFQDRFLAAAPYADCDNNGALDFFDFLCFQNEFLAGCS